MGATLTLPGMAGILLALGMAVDANILINERTREELGKRNGVIASIETGFRRAYTTIMDANLTTLIKMLILFVVGVGAIRGFAVTISLGIIVSMFTAIVLVRLLTAWWLKRTRPKTLTIGTKLRFFPDHTAIPFMRARYSGLVVSALISLASLGLAFHPGLKMGIDFAGGVVIEAKTPTPADAPALQSALMNAGLGPVQVQRFGADTDVLLLDEPTLGLDVETGYEVRTLLADIARSGKTIVLSTHDMAVVEALCRRVVVINHGRVVTDDSVANLMRLLGTRSFVVTLARPLPTVMATELRTSFSVADGSSSLAFTVEFTAADDIFRLMDFLRSSRAEVESIERSNANFEHVFRSLVNGAGGVRPGRSMKVGVGHVVA